MRAEKQADALVRQLDLKVPVVAQRGQQVSSQRKALCSLQVTPSLPRVWERRGDKERYADLQNSRQDAFGIHLEN